MAPGSSKKYSFPPAVWLMLIKYNLTDYELAKNQLIPIINYLQLTKTKILHASHLTMSLPNECISVHLIITFVIIFNFIISSNNPVLSQTTVFL